MIKDVMVRLDGSAADELPLAAVESIADLFQSRVIVLFLNVLPVLVPGEADSAAALLLSRLMQEAREAGDRIEEALTHRLARLDRLVEIRRFDVFADEVAAVAAQEARTADTFVTLRPDTDGLSDDSEHLVEGVLFGSGRHLFLVSDREPSKKGFDRVIVAWNDSRESAHAVAEALPYLTKARGVTVVVVDHETLTERKAVAGSEMVAHLKHHGIDATLHQAQSRDGDVAAALIAEARRQHADLIVMGGYGHSRMREWLLGGVTYELLHHSPVPLVVAH
jgi:nucleotide-binding universal stress UspA family protein